MTTKPDKQEAIAEMIWKSKGWYCGWEYTKKHFPKEAKRYLSLAQKILNYLEGKYD